MPTVARRAAVRAYAKINLSLLVLGKRADNFHELRTVFQTVSLHDDLAIDYRPARRTTIEVESSIDIADNLITRAVRAVMDQIQATACVRILLRKRIPMGAGLGGGSSDAAAILLAVPALARKTLPPEKLQGLAADLGSDVPFFLHGGTALGIGRGEELYPLPSARAGHAALVLPEAPVSTPEAYRALARPRVDELTLPDLSNRMKKFQSLVAGVVCPRQPGDWQGFCENDFEAVIFQRHPLLKSLHRKLLRSGAGLARMSGSGSALFGVFPSRPILERASAAFRRLGMTVEKMNFISREQYRAQWRRWLSGLVDERTWPPRAR
jgi:4-diphosphocytidyl-2-C-methyl-D-erythritol kinase